MIAGHCDVLLHAGRRGHPVAGREPLVGRAVHLPDTPGAHHLTEPDRGHVGRHVVEPAAHRGIDRQQLDGDHDLALGRLGDRLGGRLPHIRREHALWSAGQANLSVHVAHLGRLLWSQTIARPPLTGSVVPVM